MPLLKISENSFPEWSELTRISIHSIKPDEQKIIRKDSQKYVLFVISGTCTVQINQEAEIYGAGEIIYSSEDPVIIKAIEKVSKVVIVEGFWNDEIGSSGIFKMSNSISPKNIGDPVNYVRKTDFDNHYHDFDEYWIILEGSGIAVTENKKYQFHAGDCIATKMGDHHDLPEVFEEIHAVYFETSLKGKKRTGHLWVHTHGKPHSGEELI